MRLHRRRGDRDRGATITTLPVQSPDTQTQAAHAAEKGHEI